MSGTVVARGDHEQCAVLLGEPIDGFFQWIDARLIGWAATLTPEWLAETLTYTSKVDGATRTRPRWLLVVHLFNHQTHHRGQVTTLLTQQGNDPGSTDLPFMPGL